MYYDSAGTPVYTTDDPEYYNNGASVNHGYAWGTSPPQGSTGNSQTIIGYTQGGRGSTPQPIYGNTETPEAPAAPPGPPAPPPAQQQALDLQAQQQAELDKLAAEQQAAYDQAMLQSAQLQTDMLANQQLQTDYMNQTLALQQQQAAQAQAEQDRAYAQASYQQQLLGNNLALAGQQTTERQQVAQDQNQMGIFSPTEQVGVQSTTKQGDNPNTQVTEYGYSMYDTQPKQNAVQPNPDPRFRDNHPRIASAARFLGY